jgi:hypothetical protein
VKYRLSDNVGGVKCILGVLRHPVLRERHFALRGLVLPLLFQPKARLQSLFRSELQSEPCISSVRYSDHDYQFRLPAEGERDAHSIARCLLHTVAISGRSRVRTEPFPLPIVPLLAPHPVKMHRQLPGHSYFCDLPSAPEREMEVLTTPLGDTPHRNLCRLDQQEAQHRVSLLGDMSQASAIAAGIFQGTSPR